MKNGDKRMKKLNTAIALALGIASTSVLAQETAFSANTSANASTSASLSITNGANSQSATQANTQTSAEGEALTQSQASTENSADASGQFSASQSGNDLSTVQGLNQVSELAPEEEGEDNADQATPNEVARSVILHRPPQAIVYQARQRARLQAPLKVQ